MKRGGPDHPKVHALAKALHVSQATAIGHLELLWHWASKYAPQGDIGRHSDVDIARACCAHGAAHGARLARRCPAFVQALRATGWIDDAPPPHRLVIHDIKDHADNAWRERLDKMGLTWWDGTPPRLQSRGRPKAKSGIKTPPGWNYSTNDIPPPETRNLKPENSEIFRKGRGSSVGGKIPTAPPVENSNPIEEAPSGSLAGAWEAWREIWTGPCESNAWQTFVAKVNTPELIEACLTNTPAWLRTPRYSDGFHSANSFLRSGVWHRPPATPAVADATNGVAEEHHRTGGGRGIKGATALAEAMRRQEAAAEERRRHHDPD